MVELDMVNIKDYGEQHLVCEEPELALLAIERRPVVYHLGVNLHLGEGSVK